MCFEKCALGSNSFHFPRALPQRANFMAVLRFCMRKIISSSEVAAYNFCARAWYFAAKKVPMPESKRKNFEKSFASGNSVHEEHFHRVRFLRVKEAAAKLLLAAIVVILAAYAARFLYG